MAEESSLLERLARARKGKLGPETQVRIAGRQGLGSILRHLERLLNSREGSAPAQLDYGIPDPQEVMHNHSDALQVIRKAIKASIEKYEPRLTNVSVTQVSSEDVLALRFQITAQLAGGKERVPVLFDTVVDATGRIRIKN